MNATGQGAHEIAAAPLPIKIPVKEGANPRFTVNAETTDRLIVFDTRDRCHTIGLDRLPGG